MKKLFALLLFCLAWLPVAAQTSINPSQIRPSQNNGDVIETVGGKTQWGTISAGCPLGTCIVNAPSADQTILQPGSTGFYANIINGSYEAKQFQTPANTGNNGIANAITADCTGTGCWVESDPSYASTETIPGETSTGYGGNVYTAIPNWPTFTHVTDYRNGRQVDLYAEGGTAQYTTNWQDSRYYFNTYQVTGPTLSFSGFSDQCNFEGTGQQINGFGGVNLKSYWTCKVLNDIATAQGQNLMHISNEQCNGVGDCINQTRNTFSSGGTNAYTDEGTHDHDVLVEEQHGVPVGTVTSVGSNTVQATISAGFGTEGQGRYLGNTNAAKVISGVYPTAYTLGNPTFPPSPTIWGIDGPVPPMGQFVGTSFTPSTLIMGCTTAFGGSCPNSASVNPSGELKSATGGYAPGILNVQVVSQAPGLPNAYGTDSTGFSPGDTVCVADNEYMEETTVTAVPDSSHVTINFTKPHFNGFTIAKGGMCGYGVEVTGSTTTIGGVTYRQVWPVVGTLDSTDLLVWDHNSQQNWSHSMLIGGNATCKTATVGNFSNVGAVITMEDAANTALFRNKTGVTITTANGTYNGTFDLTSGTGYYDGTPNVANLSYTATGTPSGAVPTTGTITFCNSGFNLYPIAEVLDVLNPSTHAVDGYFKVGVNNGSFAAGDTVAEFHWPAQQIEAGGESVFQELPMQPYNGFALDGIAAGDNFTGGWALWQLDNQTAASKYQGYGGSLSTSGVGLHFKGLFGDTIQFDNAPDQTLFEVLACKPSPIGCTNKALSRFNIYLNDAVGNQFIADNPALGSIDFGNFIRVGAGGGGSGPFGMAMYSPVFGTTAFSQDQVPGSSLTPDATIEAQNYQFWSAITPPTGFQHVSMYGDGSTSLGMQFLAADGSHTTYQGGTFSLGGLQFYHPGTTTAVKTAGISVDSTTADMYLDDATPGDAGANVHAKSLALSAGCTGCGGAIYVNNGVALPTTAISANSCTAATGSPFTATGVASTNLATYGWASDPSGVAGYGSTKALDVEIVPSSGTVSVKVCNYTASSETPGAISINVRVNP